MKPRNPIKFIFKMTNENLPVIFKTAIFCPAPIIKILEVSEMS
jgi:hypothetical protein